MWMSSVQIFNGKENAKGPEWIKALLEMIYHILLKEWKWSLGWCVNLCASYVMPIIKKNDFVKMHMRRNNDRFHVFKRNGESFDSDGIKETYQYLGSMNGLLREEKKFLTTTRARYQIVKPFNQKQTLDTPYPNTRDISWPYNISRFIYWVI